MSDRLARLFLVRSAYGGRFDADGRTLLFVADLAGVPQAWALRTGARWPELLLAPRDRVQAIHPAPIPGALIADTDVGGDEQTQLVLVRGSDTSSVVEDTAHVHRFGAWSPDGKSFAFVANTRDLRWFDVYVRDLARGTTRLVLSDDSTNAVADWSPDGARLLVQRVFSNSQHELWLLDVANDAARLLTARRARYEDARFLDNDTVVLRTDLDRDRVGVAMLAPDIAAMTSLAAAEVEVDRVALAREARLIAYALNRDGANEVIVRSIDSGVERRVGGLPRGALYEYWQSGLAFDRQGRRLAISWTAEREGVDVFVHDVATGKTRQATQAPKAAVNPRRLAESEVVRYPTFDGREIPALWYPTLRATGTPPCVVYVHGGPESQHRPNWLPVVQHLVGSGFAVLAPNVRGSTGYGSEYEHADDVRKRMDSVNDLAHAARWLAESGRADGERIAVWGGSYGGFMVLAALTTDPELWAAGVCLVGIGNFVTFLQATGAYRRHLREAEYGSLEHDRDFLESISPINHLDRIRAPLLLIHGANDPRVPIGEAEQMVNRLRELGRPADLIRLDDEGHQIAKLKNRLVAYPAAIEFLR
ncbi:MAG: hypothetical protein AUH85_09830, partial [Chloroflexi bacterium 13_1_40CM_4_68_4]